MISVEEACRIVTEHKKLLYVSHITELDDIYLIPVLSNNGEFLIENTATVNKNTAEIGVFRLSRESCMNLKENGKEIEIPEKYRYPGEIKF